MEEQQAAQAAESTSASAADLTSELSSLKSQLAELVQAKAAADAAADEARRAALSEKERIAEDKKAIELERAKIKADRRRDALSKLGVMEKAAALAPDVDPSDPSGAKALEDWAKSNPEFIKRQESSGFAYDAPKGSNLGKILSGETKSPIISTAGLRKLLGGN